MKFFALEIKPKRSILAPQGDFYGQQGKLNYLIRQSYIYQKQLPTILYIYCKFHNAVSDISEIVIVWGHIPKHSDSLVYDMKEFQPEGGLHDRIQ